ncbi:MAG: beta-propeller fold lactonase family protein [Acidobacteria bacterium]|nr:beta-propeller fold lactonase family protein [Acidobacteriota bacterium]
MGQKAGLVLALVLGVVLHGCGGTQRDTPPISIGSPYFLFVSNSTAGTISGFAFNPDGSLQPVPGSPFASQGADPSALADIGGGLLFYVANRGSASISGYNFGRFTGVVTPVVGSPFGAPVGVKSLVWMPGRLYAAAESGFVAGYTTQSSGALTPLPGSPWPAGVRPEAITIAFGRFLYVANGGSNNISAYAIDSATGALTPLAGSPFSAGTSPVTIRADSGGTFLYVANAGSNDITGFAINTTSGVLIPVPGSPFLAGQGPGSMTMQDQFFYVTNSGSNDITVFSPNSATGALTRVSTIATGAGTQPVAIRAGPWRSVAPAGPMVYVANAQSANISAFVLDRNTGALTAIPSSPFSTGAGPKGMITATGPQ